MKLEKIRVAYFPCSAVMYSSQEMVLGAGAVRDCLLTGWGQENDQSVTCSSRCHERLADRRRLCFSPRNSARWCCRLYSSSPWWLCSSRCLLRSGARAVCATLAPDRSLHRSRPRSFQPSPAEKTSRCWYFIMTYGDVFQTDCRPLKMVQGAAWGWNWINFTSG